MPYIAQVLVEKWGLKWWLLSSLWYALDTIASLGSVTFVIQNKLSTFVEFESFYFFLSTVQTDLLSH